MGGGGRQPREHQSLRVALRRSIGEDGPSQMALEDIAMFRAVHGSAVLSERCGSAERLTEAMARRAGINYLRTSRPKMPILYSNDEHFRSPVSKCLAKARTTRRRSSAPG